MIPLKLTDDERARLGPEVLATERSGREIFVGLDHAESERLVRLRRMLKRAKTEAKEARDLEERHGRALVFWRLALVTPEPHGNSISSQNAFDRGYAAWGAFTSSQRLEDFKAMIVDIPREHRLAALNGWLAAFDDEAGRLRHG